jgi:hypothetical protein
MFRLQGRESGGVDRERKTKGFFQRWFNRGDSSEAIAQTGGVDKVLIERDNILLLDNCHYRVIGVFSSAGKKLKLCGAAADLSKSAVHLRMVSFDEQLQTFTPVEPSAVNSLSSVFRIVKPPKDDDE